MKTEKQSEITKSPFKRVLMCDPPEGWKYGFPKPVPQEHQNADFSIFDWLVSEGYPKEKIHPTKFPCRYWEEYLDDQNNLYVSNSNK